MTWEISFNTEGNILFIRTHGTFDMATNTELIKECLEAAGKKNCRRCLIDNSDITSEKIGALDIYSIPRVFAELGVPRNLCIAEVVSKQFAKDFHFLETVCRNNCYLVSVFFEAKDALQWLERYR